MQHACKHAAGAGLGQLAWGGEAIDPLKSFLSVQTVPAQRERKATAMQHCIHRVVQSTLHHGLVQYGICAVIMHLAYME